MAVLQKEWNLGFNGGVVDKGCPGERLKTLVRPWGRFRVVRFPVVWGEPLLEKLHRGPRQSWPPKRRGWATLLSPVAHPLSVAEAGAGSVFDGRSRCWGLQQFFQLLVFVQDPVHVWAVFVLA